MASTTKENAPPRQATLDSSFKASEKGKKRTITLISGDEVDLMSPTSIPITKPVIEAMRLRIIQLEDQLAASEQPPAKRTKTTAATAASSTPDAASGSSKADDKKNKMQVKKIFERLKKECKADGFKFQGTPKTVKFDEVYEQPEFEALFKGHGTLIQPTPENKPKSTVTIMHFNKAQVNQFFGSELKALKGNAWTRGGAPSFSKSVKLGSVDVEVTSLDVNYSKNGMKCTLKFDVQELGDPEYNYGSTWRYKLL